MKLRDYVVVTKNLFPGRWVHRDNNFAVGHVGIIVKEGVSDDGIENGFKVVNLLAQNESTVSMFVFNFAAEELEVIGKDEVEAYINKGVGEDRGILNPANTHETFSIGNVVRITGYAGDKIGGPKQKMFPVGTLGIVDAILPPDEKDPFYYVGISKKTPVNFLELENFRCALLPEELEVVDTDGLMDLSLLFEKEGISDVEHQEKLNEHVLQRLKMGMVAEMLREVLSEQEEPLKEKAEGLH